MSQDSKQVKGMQTEYSNKIGLYSNKTQSFISQINDVVINFPFKDCILEAGMTKEDKKSREERFLLQKTDTGDIDTLFDEKVLTNFKLINEQGEKPLTKDDDIEFFDENGELAQNLLIKGNNLLALHTLKSKLAGKVKLIYIDPPYNTGNDSFTYNDNFNHSTWLVFMKNRLEVAKDLLRDDGVIFVQCDDNEQAYLKVLMDEIFGRENFVNTIVWRKTDNQANIGQIARVKEYIILFSKNIHSLKLNKINLSEKAIKEYRYSDEKGKFRRAILLDKTRGRHTYDVKTRSNKILNGPWMITQENFLELDKGNEIYWTTSGDEQPYGKIYLHESNGQIPNDFWNIEGGTNQQAGLHLEELFQERKFDFPKPELLLKRIIEIATQENDIILDYHLGSATTCAVAHKMNRRYIGIEQMDYIEYISKVRLQKVIEGEQGGISKAVNWNGGGSFIYLELKKYNQEYIEQITQANSKEELNEVYKQMQLNAFLQFWFHKKDFESEEGYKSLDLETQKIKLLEILDENQLYFNKDEMNDEKHNVSDDEKALTQRFYDE